jgi:uncharacterized membrane protein YeaQ/YmgE (transglycosylase-associated protein family)
MLISIIGFIIVALLAGFIARALVPGRDKMSIRGTLILGAVGSFIGGLLGYLIFRKDDVDGAIQTARIGGSVIGAIIALLLYRRFGKNIDGARAKSKSTAKR